MVQIIGDNKKAKKYLGRIIKTLEDNGAEIDPDLEVRCNEYGMSVFSPENKEKRRLVKLPHELLIPRNAFSLRVHKGGFKIAQIDSSMTKIQRGMLKDLIKLYNATDQLKIFQETSPWIVYRDRKDILEKLTTGRPQFNTKQKLKNVSDEENFEHFTINNFLNTRLLQCTLHKKHRTPKPVIMPFIDCFNHTTQGAAFANDYEQSASIYVNYQSPIEGSDECFANYGKYDGLDTYIYYGFYDEAVHFIRSIPTSFELSNGAKIIIDSAHSKALAENLPDHVKDLAFYMPAITIDKDKDEIYISTLYIPSEKAPLSMRRILGFVIDSYDPNMDKKQRADMILVIESQVLKSNFEYYEELGKMDNSEHENALSYMTQKQLEKIKKYQENLSQHFQRLRDQNTS